MSKRKYILQESFADFYKREKSLQELKEWYNYDLRCIDKILIEGKFGDFVSGAVSKVKGFASDKLQQLFAKIIQSVVGKDKKKAQEVAAGLQNIQNNPQALQKAAAQGSQMLQGANAGSGQQQINASYKPDNNIDFLLDTVFTEQNLHELFSVGILTEAKAAKGAKGVQPAKQSRSLRPLVKQITAVLNSYKNPQTRQNTLDSFIKNINKGLTPVAQKGQQAQGAQQTQAQQAQQPQQAQGQQAQGAQQAQGQQAQGAQPQQAQGQQPQAQQGLFQKAISWVKANPNITAGAVIALVSAVAVATGGTAVLIPLIYKGLTGGAIGAGTSAISQKMAGQNVDWKKAGSAGLKGAAAGMALGGLGKLAGSAMGATPDVDTQQSVRKNPLDNWDGQEQDQAYADNAENTDDTEIQYQRADQQAVDQDSGAEQQQQPKASTTSEDPNGQETAPDGTDGSVTDDEFKKFTGTNPDPKSYQDNAIKQAFQNLKNKSGGQLGFKDADRASEEIIKFVKKNKNITDPNQIIAQAVPWTLGESVYTVNYLRYF